MKIAMLLLLALAANVGAKIKCVFFETNWYGTIIAPNAKIVLGQSHEKDLYGQFYANEIVVHQYANIKVVPFNLEQIHLEYVFNSEAGGEL